MSDRRTSFAGRRTRLLPGRRADYVRIHSRVPEAVAAALRSSGVVRWLIWEDGLSLFHAIETREGYEAMVEKISSLGPVDSSWDTLIASLLDSEPQADVVLPLVWAMDATEQWNKFSPGEPPASQES